MTTALIVVGALAVVGGLLYWLLIVTEGVYLGQRVVTLLYDIVAPRYDTIKEYDPRAEDLLIGRPIADVLAGMPTPLILDVGTGTGRVPLALLSQPHFQGRAIGMDDSRRMLEVAAGRLAPFGERITLIWRDASELPFPDGAFDAVTLIEMVEFTPDPAAQLHEAARVLRPGGVLVTSRRTGPDAKFMPGKTHTPEAFTAVLQGAGLSAVRVMPWQVDYDLVWAFKPGNAPKRSHHLPDVLACPVCATIALYPNGDSLLCAMCGARWSFTDDILDLRT